MKKYLRRYIENDIERCLSSSSVVAVVGPKFCGKTTTSLKYAQSNYCLDTKAKINLVQSDPQAILAGSVPRLIDEWQNVPDLWNCVRSEADLREDKFGQFILTGSSTPADIEDIFHSGAGRIVSVKMRTLSLYESLESRGVVSLNELFEGRNKVFVQNENFHLQDIAFYLCRGGWPLSVIADRKVALDVTENYFSTLFSFENSKNKKFRNKKSEIFRMILRSYARNISTEARRKLMISDINNNDDRNLNEDTFDEYLCALKDLFIINDVDAWNPNLRSKTSIITTPTRHFIDTSIATAALGISPDDLLNDMNSFGYFFEDFAIRDLSIYTEVLHGNLSHYRDSNGLECDAVIHLKNGNYALVEIKIGGENLIREGERNLLALRKKLIEHNMKEPSFLMILIACGNGYTTVNGVHIVPINALKA